MEVADEMLEVFSELEVAERVLEASIGVVECTEVVFTEILENDLGEDSDPK